ncbi:hypothetical protein Y032_0444g1568 [Ancylostoma ceylanicum]|uniref:CX domain-containing protein n=1 Tax=Ancylostoma ceylanicum TaxID=53326 RepID=A0A016WYR3_9BILA|nr:hypothetical protein Y032_0444g1568 [Ancylostoma ceylanicum]
MFVLLLFQGLCSIFTEGNEIQKTVGTAYKLDSQLLSPSCPRRVKIGDHVTFPNYQAPTTGPVSCADSASTPTTTISMYRKGGIYLYTNNPIPTLPSGSVVARRITLARDPQSRCKPLPVFTRANHRRLFLGSVFNVTGYYFMNGYAFADYCLCDDGACCGITALKEATSNSQYLYKYDFDGWSPTEVDQPFFVKSYWMK